MLSYKYLIPEISTLLSGRVVVFHSTFFPFCLMSLSIAKQFYGSIFSTGHPWKVACNLLKRESLRCCDSAWKSKGIPETAPVRTCSIRQPSGSLFLLVFFTRQLLLWLGNGQRDNALLNNDGEVASVRFLVTLLQSPTASAIITENDVTSDDDLFNDRHARRVLAP